MKNPKWLYVIFHIRIPIVQYMLILSLFLDHMRLSAKHCYDTNSQKSTRARAHARLFSYVCNNIIITSLPHVQQMLFLFLRVATTTTIIYTSTRAPYINKWNKCLKKPTTVITERDVYRYDVFVLRIVCV